MEPREKVVWRKWDSWHFLNSTEIYWTNPIWCVLCWNCNSELDCELVCMQSGERSRHKTRQSPQWWCLFWANFRVLREHLDWKGMMISLRMYEAETWTERNPKWTLLFTHLKWWCAFIFPLRKMHALYFSESNILKYVSFSLKLKYLDFRIL